MKSRLSLESRIARWFAASLLVLYGVIAIAVWATSRTESRQVAVLELKNEAETVATYVEVTGRLDAPELREVEQQPFPIWMRLLDDGRVVAATPGAPELPTAAPDSTSEVLYLRAPGASEPHLIVRHSIGGRGSRRRPVTAVEAIGDIASLRQLERRLVGGLFLLGLVIIPVAVRGGRLLARRALSPVATLVAEIRALSPVELGGQLSLPDGAVEEVAVLATSFNQVLARLDRSVATMRRFTADASHEIRNPLSVLRTGLEVALRRERTPGEYRALLTENLQEVERLQSILEGLFALARSEPGSEAPIQRAVVDFSAIVRETVERFTPLSAERGVEIRLDLEDRAIVSGDARFLRLIPFNLIDNALKHGPQGAAVTVVTRREGREIVLRVRDLGAGIPAQERERIFERYVRLADANTDSGSGGVGLSVVRWAAEVHGGAVRLLDDEQGAHFEVRLPAA